MGEAQPVAPVVRDADELALDRRGTCHSGRVHDELLRRIKRRLLLRAARRRVRRVAAGRMHAGHIVPRRRESAFPTVDHDAEPDGAAEHVVAHRGGPEVGRLGMRIRPDLRADAYAQVEQAGRDAYDGVVRYHDVGVVAVVRGVDHVDCTEAEGGARGRDGVAEEVGPRGAEDDDAAVRWGGDLCMSVSGWTLGGRC